MTRRLAGISLALVAIVWAVTATAYADQPLQSTNYQIDESVIGGGGLTQENSGSYQLGESIGDLAIGNSLSTDFQLNAGYETTADPTLTFIVNSGTDFGSFSPTTTATATSTFEVIDYTSYGYVVQIVGSPPTYGGHTIAAMATTGATTPGTEQFGINVVKNTNFCGAGCNLGADPNYGQFGTVSAGATSNYNTPNNFRYVSGETIVQSPASSGAITYTISYVVNVTSLTPAGPYTSNQSLVCTGTF